MRYSPDPTYDFNKRLRRAYESRYLVLLFSIPRFTSCELVRVADRIFGFCGF